MFVTSWLSSFDPGFGFQQKTYLQPWIGWHSITWVSSGVDFDFATSWKKLIFLTFSIEILCIFHAVLSRNKFQQNSVYFIPFNPISDKAKKKKEKKLVLQDKSSAKGRYESYNYKQSIRNIFF